MTIVALVDCESTGLSAADEPICIGVVLGEVDDAGRWTEMDSWSGYQEPSVPIHPAAQLVHGLKLQDLQGQRFDMERLGALIAKADVLIAHNANFDARMLARLTPIATKKWWRCSYRQWPWPKLERKRLDDVCSHFGIARPEQHEALADARALLDALNRRTGKTERSMTYMQRLLNKPSHTLNISPPQPRGRQSNSSDSESIGYIVGLMFANRKFQLLLIIGACVLMATQCS